MDIFEFLKILGCTVIVVILIAAAVWFAILVIDALDGINKKLIIIIKLLRKDNDQESIPEADKNEKDNEKDKSVDKSDDRDDVAY